MTNESIVLRDYQEKAIEGLRQGIREGKKRQILCSSTGSGKTVIASYLTYEASKKGKKIIFLADRVALIEQTSETFDRYGIPHGVMQGGHWRWRPNENVQIATPQTLVRRKWPDAELIIIDEAHGMSKTVINRIMQNDCIAIGLTATPFTAGLGKVYQGVTNVITMNTLIDQEYLSKYRIFASAEPDMTGAKIVAGEWQDNEAAERSMKVVGDCVSEYLKHGNGQKFIAFGCNVAHCEEMMRQFKESGVNCEVYSYKTPDEERSEMMKEFRKPDSKIRGLISVSALSKGLDVPDIGVVIMARPLKSSLSEHIQIMGRGLRPHHSKEICTILDLSGNTMRFWSRMNEFFENGIHELDDGTKKIKEDKKIEKKEKKPVNCPKCHHVHNPAPFCPSCGHKYEKKNQVEVLAGTLKEIGSTVKSTLFEELYHYAINDKGKDLKNAQKWVQAMHKNITGTFSKKTVFTVDPKKPELDTVNKIRHQQIKYAMGMKKAAKYAR